MRISQYLELKEARAQDPWSRLPKGWTQESAEKFWKSIGGSATKCMKKIKGKVDDPGAFCASLKDIMKRTTQWRKGRKPRKGR